MQWILIPFGWAFTIAILALIAVRYLRGRADLLTTWNVFLLGSVNFVGIAAIQSGYAGVQYDIYDDVDYVRFVLGAVTFYTVCMFAYYVIKFPRRAAGRSLRKWPSRSPAVLALLLPVCVLWSLSSMLLPPLPGPSQFLSLTGKSAALIAVAYAFIAWYRQPMNPIYAWGLVGIGIYSLFISILGSSGRRDLLSLMITIPICLYWLRLRYRSVWSTAIPMVVGTVIAVVVIAGYSEIRHFGSDSTSNVGRAWDLINKLPSAVVNISKAGGMLGGDAVESSLLAIHHYTNNADPYPFHTVVYVLVNPIPRAFWPDKPEGLGTTLPRDSGLYTRIRGSYNIGVGIVGVGYHEGGLHMLVFYGLLLGVCFRFADELLVRQSDNPFLLGIFGSVSGQVFALSRGELGLFLVLIIGGIVTGLVLSGMLRLLFGTGTVYPTDQERIAHAEHMINQGGWA